MEKYTAKSTSWKIKSFFPIKNETWALFTIF